VLIIALVVLILGGLAYAWNKDMVSFLLTSEERERRENQRIAQLFPDALGDYVIQTENTRKVEFMKECRIIEEHPDLANLSVKGEVCGKNAMAEYRQSGSDKVVFVQTSIVEKGKDLYLDLLKEMGESEKLGDYDVIRIEGHELGWYPVKTFDVIVTAEGTWKNHEGGVGYSYDNLATGSNPVLQYFINKYPPVK